MGSFVVPKEVRKQAQRGLDLRKKHNKGGLDTKTAGKKGIGSGVARATSLKNGRVSYDTIKRMIAFFKRHERYKKEGYHKDRTSASYISWLLWGGDAGYSWAKGVLRKEESKKRKELSEVNEEKKYYKVLSVGSIYDRSSGDLREEVTLDLLKELKEVFDSTNDPVIIDWEHTSSPFNDKISTPQNGLSLGEVIDLRVDEKEGALFASIHWTKEGEEVIKKSEGLLWTSPEYLNGNTHDRSTGEKVGKAQLLAITLTPRPAQKTDKIQKILLTEKGFIMNQDELKLEETQEIEMSLDDQVALMKKQIDQIMSMIDGLTSKLNEEYKKKEMTEEEKDKKKEMTEEEKDKQLSELKHQVALLTESNDRIFQDKAIQELLYQGKIKPSEKDQAIQAYKARKDFPIFWKALNERPKQDFKPIGHGKTIDTNQNALDQIEALRNSKDLSFDEAYQTIAKTSPHLFN